MIIPEMSNHICIRYSDLKSIDCAYEHKKVIQETGYVWFGKIGSKPRRDALDKILEEDVSYIILKSKKECYICTFNKYLENIPEDKNYPAYYDESFKIENFSIWFRLTSMIKIEDNNILDNIIVKSSRNKLINSCNSSMASHFFTFNRNKLEFEE